MSVFAQLTPRGAVIPYGICIDPNKQIWVATKGGLYKFSEDGQECLFSEPNKNYKQAGAFCTVLCTKDKNGQPRIVAKFSDEHSVLSQLTVYDLDGTHLFATLIEGKVQGVCTSPDGVVYLTTQPNFRKSEILRIKLDDFFVQDTLLTSSEYGFGQLCYIPSSETLAVAASILPISPHSEQEIQIVDPSAGRAIFSFGNFGKDDGQLYHPRCIQLTPDGGYLSILDKMGRIQKFSLEKSPEKRYLGLIGKISANLGNGFCFVDSDRILVTCSGIVRDEESGSATCSDWIECLNILSADD